jgi:hypothetical protein
MKIVLWSLLAALLTAKVAAADPGISSKDVEAALKAPDPRIALAKYWDCSQPEKTVCSAIETGDAEWLTLAEKMLDYSDAGSTEDLLGSLGRAMQRKPERVLPLVGKTPLLDVAHVCVPFISDELPVRVQRGQLQRSRRAIARVKGLNTQKQACLQFIDEQLKAPHVQVR